jgi:hypothetical protein
MPASVAWRAARACAMSVCGRTEWASAGGEIQFAVFGQARSAMRESHTLTFLR